MGMNYYWHESGILTCPCCNQKTPNLHIGKSSWGWNFSLRIHPYEGIASLDDWKAKWATGAIFNEEGERLTPDEMLFEITEREHPDGLLKHEGLRSADGRYRPGGKTWDLIDCEFS